MKSRNIQLKPTAGFLIPMLLACFAAAPILAPTPASARDQVPFRAAFGTEVQIEFVYPFFYISVTGQGNTSHLGRPVLSQTTRSSMWTAAARLRPTR